MIGNRNKHAKRKHRSNSEAVGLDTKIERAGGQTGFGLGDVSFQQGQQRKRNDNNNNIPQKRTFRNSRSKKDCASTTTTRSGRTSSVQDAYYSKKSSSSCSSYAGRYRNHSSIAGKSTAVSSRRNKNSISSVSHSNNLSTTYATRLQQRRRGQATACASIHIVCAISENLAKETCVASLDAGSPVSLEVTKQGNGQTYAETLAYLQVLKPHEVLLNEGRRNSQLARKVLELYNIPDERQLPQQRQGTGSRADADERSSVANEGDLSVGPPQMSTIVKFLSRSCFDQTKGAELLQRVAIEETYDASIVDEYILLSASFAVLHYTQQTLGAAFSRNSLQLRINSGGNNRMSIDRSTLLQLELLANARTGKTKNSLIGTIDRTKTTVGAQLLRTNIMSPPTRVDTINARLDLVDTFLADEEFFYTVMEHLNSLPDVDKMLTNIVLVPRKNNTTTSRRTGARGGSSSGGGEGSVIKERMASKGISALVCIKTTLTQLPALTKALVDRFRFLDGTTANQQVRAHQPEEGSLVSDVASTTTGRTSLLIGLGGGAPCGGVRLERYHLLRAIIMALEHPSLKLILDSVSAVFTESTSFSRNANAMRHQECFALKSENNGLMDVLRKAFLANVDDIYKLADEYAGTHGLHVSVRYSNARGYFLAVPANDIALLPQIFTQTSKSGKFITCTTEEIASLNTRARDNVQDLLLMTNEKIQEVLDVARGHYDALASLSDAIALLDMCHSFADTVTLSQLPWCRPLVTNVVEDNNNHTTIGNHNIDINHNSSNQCGVEGTMIIRNGRYGIDCSSNDDTLGGFVPNDTYVAKTNNFIVISGINGSGKSTYLKQIAIIVILAHCGSYVPAEQASLPIRNRLLCRIGNADDQEHNISTFMLEMKETAFICNNADKKSLILIDELGRATSNEDGVAIGWAVSEFILKQKALTFFVSHYPHMSNLSDIYPVQNQHMEASVADGENGEISYSHKVSSGPCTVTADYGVKLAASCGWPMDTVSEAYRIEASLRDKLSEKSFCAIESTAENSTSNLLKTYQIINSLSHRFKALSMDDHGSSLRAKLTSIQENLLPVPDKNIRTNIQNILQCQSKNKSYKNAWVTGSPQQQNKRQRHGPALATVDGDNTLVVEDETNVESREKSITSRVQLDGNSNRINQISHQGRPTAHPETSCDYQSPRGITKSNRGDHATTSTLSSDSSSEDESSSSCHPNGTQSSRDGDDSSSSSSGTDTTSSISSCTSQSRTSGLIIQS